MRYCKGPFSGYKVKLADDTLTISKLLARMAGKEDQTALTGDTELTTFASAFEERYSHLLDEDDFKEPQIIGSPGASRVVEFVGMDKVTRTIKKKITKITLPNMDIVDVGSVSLSMQRRISQVEELDLSFNKNINWTIVAKIVSSLPSLKMLTLSKNSQLANVQEYDDLSKEHLKNIKTLVMANCDFNWEQVFISSFRVWPNDLESLVLHGNRIDSVFASQASYLNCLKVLDLSANPIKSLGDVLSLGFLPSLQELNLSGCEIKTTTFPPFSTASVMMKLPMFQKLEKLNISSNFIETWIDIAQFNQLPALKDLNVKSNPVMKDAKDYESAFNLIIGRIGNLVKLNNEIITPKSRQEGERYYLNVAQQELLDTKADQDSIEWKASHPRFTELIKSESSHDNQLPF